jgi:hypothetical protein
MIEIPSPLFQIKMPVTGRVIELDLIEIQLIMEQVDGEPDPMKRIMHLRDALSKLGVDVQLGEAWSIILASGEAFDEFKKKLPLSLQSRITTSSTLPGSTPEPLLSLNGT